MFLMQVMAFLLKVKRAKFVLDKARRWMWKVLFLQYFSNTTKMRASNVYLNFVNYLSLLIKHRIIYHVCSKLMSPFRATYFIFSDLCVACILPI